MTNEKHSTDVVIIGAGPVGLFAIFELGMLKIKCHVVDALEYTGGQCTALYPEKPIYDIAGYPKIEAAELIKQLEKQAAPFNPTYHLDQRVEKLRKIENGWEVSTSKGAVISCGAILIAAGCGAFGPNRPPISGLEEYEKTRAVRYMVQSKEDFRDKKIVIAGGGDSAIDWALSLSGIASHISLVHRRDKFRAAPESVDQVHKLAEAGKIDMVIPYQLDGLKGAGGKLAAVVVKDLDGKTKEVPADILLPFYGLAMELGPIATWGLNVDTHHIMVDPATCKTSADGIYAVGDINNYPGKLKLIVCGFSESAMAAHAIRKHIRPDEVFHFEYSTTKGVG
jgi:thioredoxin reductase (NADPH)